MINPCSGWTINGVYAADQTYSIADRLYQWHDSSVVIFAILGIVATFGFILLYLANAKLEARYKYEAETERYEAETKRIKALGVSPHDI